MQQQNVHDIILPTNPPMSIADVVDRLDGVYFCVKNDKSEMLWCNQNFADLVGQTKEEIINNKDPREEHVRHDKEVMAHGKPLLNFHETIDIKENGKDTKLEIVTQKGLLRKKGGDDIIGITVNFSKRDINRGLDYWKKKLNLIPIDLGGYFSEIGKSNETLHRSGLPNRFVGERPFHSTNYYVLPDNQVLKLHKLNQDELWFHHYGSSFRLHIFPTNGDYYYVDVGNDLENGDVLSSVAPGGTWFGAELKGYGFGIAACCLAPGWDKRDSFVPTNDDIKDLYSRFKDKANIIHQLSNSTQKSAKL